MTAKVHLLEQYLATLDGEEDVPNTFIEHVTAYLDQHGEDAATATTKEGKSLKTEVEEYFIALEQLIENPPQ